VAREDDPKGKRERPARGLRRERARPVVEQDPKGTAAPPADPRLCRICGERVLDMKYHLQRVHPRPEAGGHRDIRLDGGTLDALREMAGLLEEAKESVFKEPLTAMHLIDRAREWIAWTKDRSNQRPRPRVSSFVPSQEPKPAAAKRHDMRAPPAPAKRPDDGDEPSR
jgi:hypothetical protein